MERRARGRGRGAERGAPRRLRAGTLVAGVNVRPLARSARRAGADPVSVDWFGDRDHRRIVPVLSLREEDAEGYAADELVALCRRVEAGAAVYGADLENHPDLVARLADGARLLGNPPEVLREVRDPFRLHAVLRRAGLPAPSVRRAGRPPPGARTGRWLRKPLRGGGGRGVRPWRPGADVPPDAYLQQWVRGTPASALFVADGRGGRLLAVTEMLVGRPTFGASGFTYCGSLLRLRPAKIPLPPGPEGDEVDLQAVRRLVERLADAFGLVGLNGVDGVLSGGAFWPVEVNPRWTAAMELLEPGPTSAPRGPAPPLFEVHRRACDGTLPSEGEIEAAGRARHRAAVGPAVVGKAVVRAGNAARVPDLERLEGLRLADVPEPGEPVAAGGPVCTVLAHGPDRPACLDRLASAARRVLRTLEPGKPPG